MRTQAVGIKAQLLTLREGHGLVRKGLIYMLLWHTGQISGF